MKHSNLSLNKVSHDQLNLLTELTRNTFFESYAEQNSTVTIEKYIEENFNSKQLSHQLTNRFSEFYVLFKDSKATGYLKLNTNCAQTETADMTAIEIERIYVLETYQGQNLGSTLLKKAFEIYQSGEHSFLWLGVWENNNKAIQFYQKNGFVKYGEHKFDFGGDLQTDWLMKFNN